MILMFFAAVFWLIIFNMLGIGKSKRTRRSNNSLSGAFRAQSYMRKVGVKTPRIMRSGRFW